MADSMQTIFGGGKYAQPDEFAAIKKFIKDKFQADVDLSLRDEALIILVPNSALSGTLRLHLEELKEYVKTDKKIIIRLG